MPRILIVIACICFSFQADAQKYRTSTGVRLGSNFGLTVQQLAFKNVTVEGIFQAPIRSTDAAKITLLLEQHNKLIGKRLNFYYGAGMHKGWAPSSEDPDPSGITLIAGVEMSLGRLNLSLDYKPAINAFSGVRFFESQSALSLRYILVKPKKKKFNWKFWKKKD